MMKNYRITFWTPGHAPAGEDLFGCASKGMFTEDRWLEPESSEVVCWKSVQGTALSGTYDQMLAEASCAEQTPACILCFFTGGEGNDAFVDALQSRFPHTPIAGGTAARLPEQTAGEVLPAGQDGAVLLVYGEEARADSYTAHRDVVAQVRCEVENRRDIVRIEGVPAMEYYNARRAEYGRSTDDFESMTFHELCGKNVHCCAGQNGALHAGADVQTQPLVLARTTKREATDAMQAYLPAENCLSVGCAGIKTLLLEPIRSGKPGNVGIFLFGEVARFPDGRSRFCNLTLGRLLLDR